MLIENDHPAANQTSCAFWTDELKNCRILLNKLDTAIAGLLSDGIAEYTLDTGQDRQTVKRFDLPMLYARRDALLCQIQVLESRLQIGGSSARRIVPGF